MEADWASLEYRPLLGNHASAARVRCEASCPGIALPGLSFPFPSHRLPASLSPQCPDVVFAFLFSVRSLSFSLLRHFFTPSQLPSCNLESKEREKKNPCPQTSDNGSYVAHDMFQMELSLPISNLNFPSWPLYLFQNKAVRGQSLYVIY